MVVGSIVEKAATELKARVAGAAATGRFGRKVALYRVPVKQAQAEGHRFLHGNDRCERNPRKGNSFDELLLSKEVVERPELLAILKVRSIGSAKEKDRLEPRDKAEEQNDKKAQTKRTPLQP